MFIEDICECVSPEKLVDVFRWYGAVGVLNRINGIIVGKFNCNPKNNDYKDAILSVVRDELGLNELRIMYGMNFGHTTPIFMLPYGALAEIDCDNMRVTILENGVI